MTKLIDLTKFLDNYLKTAAVADDSWNGLQFEAGDEVKKIAVAVDAALDTYKKAAEWEADLLITHHGHFWKGANPSFASYNKERLEFLRENKLSLYVSHLPLDKHPEVGNNAQVLKILGAEIEKEFAELGGQAIGWIGKLNPAKSFKEIQKILEDELGSECRTLNFGKDQIKTVAVCSGGGGYAIFNQALNSGVDLYISGDAIEMTLLAKDAKFNAIFAGHHATEITGVKALGKLLENEFKLETKFIDIKTGF